MMRPIKYVAIATLVFIFSCDTEKNVPPVFDTFFTKYYGEDGNQEAVDLLLNTDGSMVMLGNTTSQTNSNPTPFMLKIDGRGEVVWQRRLGEVNERAKDVELDSDGNLIVVSNILSSVDPKSQIRIFRIDQNGRGIDSAKIINTKTVSGIDIPQTATAVTLLNNGDFIVVGSAGPDYVIESSPPPTTDEADLLVYTVDKSLQMSEQLTSQGGERVGQWVKAFQSQQPGPVRYLMFGSSDRPLNTEAFSRAFEVIPTDQFGIQSGERPSTGSPDQVQVASTAIPTTGYLQEGYLMVGTSTSGGSSNILVAQYVNDNNKLIVRLNRSLLFGRKMEGISAAVGLSQEFYILGNLYQDNNNRDITLIKLANDGAVLGQVSLGSLEGDDLAASVKVLSDGRIAVFGTIQLETQKKFMLVVLGPDGSFVQ